MNHTHHTVSSMPQQQGTPWQAPERFLQIITDPWYQLLIKLQHVVTIATYQFWEQHQGLTIHLPITTNAVSSPMGLGSDSLPVEIELFNQPTYLADSMQFLLEYGCRFHQHPCFYLMPSFRGEAADDTHLCQFYHSEVELRGSLEEAISLAEDYFRYLCHAVIQHCADLLKQYAHGYQHVAQASVLDTFPQLTLAEAAQLLNNDPDLMQQMGSWCHPTRAGEQALLKHFGTPLWLTHWDHLAVPFYQAFADNSHHLARNADFLLGFGEVIGLGERHQSAEAALDALQLHQVSAEPYRWYLDMKQHFPLQTSGFGMGVERFLLWVLDHDDIRDLQLLPRFNGISIIP